MQENKALMTDYYQLTMDAAYAYNKVEDYYATFDLFVRKLPKGRRYLLVAGTGEALKYLEGLRFTNEQIGYLRTLPEFATQPESLFTELKKFRFTGDVWAMPEGTVAFGNEPIMIVKAPMIQAQVVETYLENVVGSQTMFASKASRIMNVILEGANMVKPPTAVEFGTRRSQHPEAAIMAARSAYIAGFAGTSNVEAGFRYGIPVVGTMAHSFVMDFPTELEAFRAYAKAHPENTTLLVDTYNVKMGVENAIIVGKEMAASGKRMKGIRIDSGDLAPASMDARKRLDEEGLGYASIVLSSDLEESKIAQMKIAGVDCQTWAVGTSLATSADYPNLPIVYKLAQRQTKEGKLLPCIKVAEGKNTLPGFKQVYRQIDLESNTAVRDVICLANEKLEKIQVETFDSDGWRMKPGAVPLLEKAMEKGKIIAALPSLNEIRDRAKKQVDALPENLRRLPKDDYEPGYEVALSLKLNMLQGRMVDEVNKRTNNLMKAQKARA